MTHKYETNFMYKHLAIAKIFDFIEPNTKILDVGCSTGFLGESLIKEKNCIVTGIDNDKLALKIACKKLHRTIYANVEKDSINLKQRFFDYIILADILEHTKEPENIIKKFKKFLKPSGFFLISLPNIAHPVIRIKLLFGRWDYQECGIMDKTHLKFFTYKTAKQLLENAGLKILEENTAGKFAIKKTFAAQFVFKCKLN